MRNPLILTTVFLCASVFLLGCPKKGGDADAAADAAGEAEAPPIDAAAAAPIAAKNSADIARFAAEVAIANESGKTLSVANVHTSPRAGAVVATLKIGTDVTKV